MKTIPLAAAFQAESFSPPDLAPGAPTVEMLVSSRSRRLTVDDHAVIIASGFVPPANDLDAQLVAPLSARNQEGQAAL